jgi:hypothetical protein
LPNAKGCANVQPMADLVPHALLDLLAFYTKCHPEARFGEFDIETLQCTIKAIDDAAKKVIAAEEALSQTREQFRGVEAEMTVKASRVLSFLRIHVEGDEQQLAQLEAISNAMPSARRKPKTNADAVPGTGGPRRGRPRKNKILEEVNGAIQSGTKSDG